MVMPQERLKIGGLPVCTVRNSAPVLGAAFGLVERGGQLRERRVPAIQTRTSVPVRSSAGPGWRQNVYRTAKSKALWSPSSPVMYLSYSPRNENLPELKRTPAPQNSSSPLLL